MAAGGLTPDNVAEAARMTGNNGKSSVVGCGKRAGGSRDAGLIAHSESRESLGIAGCPP